MALLESALSWQYLIFELPFIGAILYVLLLATGAMTTGEGDADSDVDGAHFDHDMDHGVEHHLGGGHDHDSQSNLFYSALSFFGVGKVPLSILMVCLWMLWGFVGVAMNVILQKIIPWPLLFIWPSIFVAGISAIYLTRYLAIGVYRLMPSTESYGVSRGSLEGKEGSAYDPITEKSGTVQVRDQYGNLHIVECRVQKGEKVIPVGQQVILLEYDHEKEVYIGITEEQLHDLMSSNTQ